MRTMHTSIGSQTMQPAQTGIENVTQNQNWRDPRNCPECHGTGHVTLLTTHVLCNFCAFVAILDNEIHVRDQREREAVMGAQSALKLSDNQTALYTRYYFS